MPVLSGSLLANKDASSQGFQPLLICAFTFSDGAIYYVSTHPITYSGHTYDARVDKQDIAAIQARSETGVDRISEVSVRLFNADQVPWTQYEMATGRGFKGAILKLALVLADIDPSTGNWVFTSDSPAPVKFSGVCDAPQCEQGASILTVRATTSHNMARVDFPIVHVQQRCINSFPRNALERGSGATDMSDWRWGCGHDPDVAGTDPEIGGDARRGNTTTAFATDAQGNVVADGAGIFISCNWTKQDCVARGMYAKDSSNRVTGRFTAEQWAPASNTRESQSKSYGQGKNVTVFSSRNDSIYNRSFPMLYGSQWIKAPIVCNVLGDANSTRFEIGLCVGDIGVDGIWTVLVNGVIVPPIESAKDKKLMRWNFCDGVTRTSTHTGSRNGFATADAGYDSQGDPHGGIATIEVVVYSELAQGNSVPDVRVLCNGPKLKTPNTANPSDQAAWPYVVTTLPPWIILDMLVWSNYSYAEIDLQSFIDAANYCGTGFSGPVSYMDAHGSLKTHNRFGLQFALEDRRKANEVIQAALRSFNGSLVPNSDTGLLQLFIRQTLADQQPAPIPGSNYNTAIDSLHMDDAPAHPHLGSGFVAYLIDESVIQQDGNGMPKMRGPYTLPSAQCPNRVSFPFQDEENVFADDSISVTDPDDVARASGYAAGGAQIPAGFAPLGIANFDQGIRQANVILAEGLRGNRWGDTRGTYFWELELTSRVEHLRCGHIILFQYQAQTLRPQVQLESPHGTGIMGVLLRVEAIKPATNYERVTLTARWHEDIWYTDIYGQQSAQLYSNPLKNLPPRPPYPWKPYGQQPIANDSMWAFQDWSFAIAQSYRAAADGTAIAHLSIAGNPPANQLSTGAGSVQPPFLKMQANTANTGGTIPGGIRILMAISAQDANTPGKWSPLSVFSQVDVPTGTNTNTVTTPTINWDDAVGATVAWVLYAGTDDHDTLCAQATGSGNPATITFAALNTATYGPPDPLADSILFEVKLIQHGGVWGDACSGVTSNGDGTGFLTFGTACTTHQFAQVSASVGYDLSLLAKALGSTANVPLADFHVIDNTGGVYHVSPDPFGLVAAGDVFVMRAFPSIVTATTIGDPNFVTNYATGGFGGAGNEETGRRLRIVKGTGEGQERNIVASSATTLTVDTPWDTLPDNTTRFIIEEAAWQDQPYSGQSAGALLQTPAPTVAILDIANYSKQTILIRALIADPQWNTSLARWSPFREIYLWGGQGTRTITASGTQLLTDGTVLCDTTAGNIVFTCLIAAQVPNQILVVRKTTADANTVTVTAGGTDTFPGGGTTQVLTDNSTANGSTQIKFPG